MILTKAYVMNSHHNTVIEVVDENTISIDGEDYYFPPDFVEYDPVEAVPDARRVDGVLHATVVMLTTTEQPGQRPAEEIICQ